jgi:CubicO group peptidase (beta-lactamase class C family)
MRRPLMTADSVTTNPNGRLGWGSAIAVAAIAGITLLFLVITPMGSKLARASVMARSHLRVLEPAHTDWDRAPLVERSDVERRLANRLGLSASSRTDAFLVIHHGRLAFEWYRNSKLLEQAIGPNTRQGAAAAAKGLIGSLLFGLALSDSVVHLDDPVAMYVPAWARDSLRSKITLRHLATHSSGLDDVSFVEDTLQPGWKSDYYRHPGKRFETAQCCVPILFAAGTKQRYSGIGYYVLAYVLSKAYADHGIHDLHDLLRARVMEPMGISSADWSISYDTSYAWNGLTLYAIGSGAQLTPRAAAKVGELLLQRGRWKDRQLISPEAASVLIEYVTIPHTEKPQRSVGLSPAMGWWTNHDGVLISAPNDAFAAIGAGHQVVLVIPSLDVVAVRFGSSLGAHQTEPGFSADLDSLLVKPLIESLRAGDL